MQRIDYSNDTILTSTRGPLSRETIWTASTSSRDEGLQIIGGTFAGFTNTVTRQYYPASQRVYWIGGENNRYIAQRFDIPNDTVNAVPRYSTTNPGGSPGNNRRSGVGNQNYGYVALNSGSSTHVERLDYANETPTSSHLYLANGNSMTGGSLDGPFTIKKTTARISGGGWSGGSSGAPCALYSGGSPGAIIKISSDL